MDWLIMLHHALQACEEHGGVTIHVNSGHQPNTGFGVSTHKERERILADRPTGEDLLAYIKDNLDLLGEPQNYLGVWKEGSDWYLDVTQVEFGHLAAMDLARDNHQLSIYSFDTHRVLGVMDTRGGNCYQEHCEEK